MRLEVAVRAEAARMHHPLGNPLVVEVEDLLAEVVVLEQRRPALAGAQRVLVVRDRRALLRGQDRNVAARHLVRFAAGSAQHGLVAVGRVIAP